MADASVLHVLVICAANQCRSRAAEILLSEALPNQPGVRISSAGVAVEQATPMCSQAEKFLLHHGVDPRGYAERPSQALTPEMLETAHLVLVADKVVRAAVVAMAHDSRTKTFSLRGAGSAASYINANDLVSRARVAHSLGLAQVVELIDEESVTVCEALGDDPGKAIRWLCSELEAAQGHAAPLGGHDIPDAHLVLQARHSKTLEEVLASVQPLAQLLRGLTARAQT